MEQLRVPEEFNFPFPPYAIQLDFMKNLYSCLEGGKLGIFESPTGTGKTLSIICGALKWLKDNEVNKKTMLIKKSKELETQIREIEKKTEQDWFTVQTDLIALKKENQQIQSMIGMLDKQENKYKEYEKIIEDRKNDQNLKKIISGKYKSAKSEAKDPTLRIESDLSHENFDEDVILEENDYTDSQDIEDDDIDEYDEYEMCKIFFCSRTHSQLSQFISELKKSPYSNEISLVPLSSRNNFCINPDVKSLPNANMMNEKCLQLLKKVKPKKDRTNKKAKTSCCPYQPGDQSFLMAEILTSIQDIAEIVKKGQELKTCPYYSSRKSVKDGQLIIVPYNSIFHKNTRVSSGINLKNNILIVDEAHNLLEAIEQMHTAFITGENLLQCLSQLMQYCNRFKHVLSAKNTLFLSQLQFCLKKLLKMLGANSKSHPKDKVDTKLSSKVYDLNSFENIAEIDNINMFDLSEFIKNSKLVHKLKSYVEKYEQDFDKTRVIENKKGVSAFLETIQTKKKSKPIKLISDNKSSADNELNRYENKIDSPLIFIQSFFETLKNNLSDGRIFVVPGSTVGDSYIKFQLLNPSAHFSDIVNDARAIIVAGGTMEPISEFKQQLFLNAGADPSRIVTFSCDHIVPKENISTIILNSGPMNIEFEFNYQNRENIQMLNEVGRILVNVCNIIPAGIVIFLPSYNYEDLLFNHLESSGILKKINLKKQIFREPKSSSQVNKVLEEYAHAIKKPQQSRTGAILFSVVGGKLSEGLNFSDELGRCVMVLGMPYPNIKSLELQEKMKYLNENVDPQAGKMYYENSCMKAVNQCIGRAVRHRNDYAIVILLDKRYGKKISSLPRWIQRTTTVHNSFGTAISTIAKFFSLKKQVKATN